MALNNIATTVRNDMADAFTAAIDVGSADPGGDFAGFTAAFAALLFACQCSNPAFAAAVAGVATANAISDATAVATGTFAVGRIRNRDNTQVADFDNTDLVLNTNAIVSGDTISITAATITQPAGP